MPDTGLFYVLDLDAVRDRNGNLDLVTAVSVRCNHCKHVTHAKAPKLETMPGGTLLACIAMRRAPGRKQRPARGM